tara:strand:- start:580 stop:1479 length:900 start_codon:yes stop_codon:yes gene_type:complete
MKDYYQILGVPTDATPELIKAVYKALVKLYHPDVFQGDSKFAQKKLQSINEAFEILSNEVKRGKYNEQYEDKIFEQTEESFSEQEFSDEFNTHEKIIERNWSAALEFMPELEFQILRLSKINKNLAFVFKAFLLETKKFDLQEDIANMLLDNFMISRFGNDKNLHHVVLKAIETGNKKIALEINKAIKLMGEDSISIISKKLMTKYPDFKHWGSLKVYLKPGLYCFESRSPKRFLDQFSVVKIKIRIYPDFTVGVLEGSIPDNTQKKRDGILYYNTLADFWRIYQILIKDISNLKEVDS